MSPGKLVDEKDVGCQDKSGPGKIHEVILVLKVNKVCNEAERRLLKRRIVYITGSLYSNLAKFENK